MLPQIRRENMNTVKRRRGNPTSGKGEEKVAAGVELLGKLPPLQIYRCPLFSRGYSSEGSRFSLVPRRIPSPKSDDQASNHVPTRQFCERLLHKGGMAASQIRMRNAHCEVDMDILNILGIRCSKVNIVWATPQILAAGTYRYLSAGPLQLATATNQQDIHQPKQRLMSGTSKTSSFPCL
jgi:hypothetical protein